MKYIGIIAEYNPFHNGHKYQTDKIREVYPDAVIAAVMSGNATQRGEIALMPKQLRAKAAVTSGIDLALELPSIYSQSAAEVFARGGVDILNRLNIIDFLCFGSETGNADLLQTVSGRMTGAEFESRLHENINTRGNKNLSYASQIEKTYREMYGDGAEIFTGSNDILALEYMKALKKQNSSIVPLPVKRTGGAYNSDAYENNIASATAIRNIISRGGTEVKNLVPESSCAVIKEAEEKNLFFDRAMFDVIILSNLKRICNDICAERLLEYPDFNKGAAHRFIECVNTSKSAAEFSDRMSGKTYSKSRIRRMALYVLFGIKRADTQSPPSYTRLLGANEKGLSALNKIKKTSGIPIVTKETFRAEDAQLQRNIFIDSLCELTVKGKDALAIVKQKPFIMGK